MSTIVLVVEDDADQREQLAGFLRSLSLQVDEAEDAEAARERLEAGGVDLVVTDLRLPGESGLELLGWARPRHPLVDFLVVTAFGSVETAVDAMRRGAHDFLTKPIDLDILEHRIRSLLEKRRLVREVDLLRRRLEEGIDPGSLVAESPAMRGILEIVRRVAPTDSTVLVSGPSGTGKERIADLVQARSRRADRPYLKLNCAALPEGLLESELFGHARGAFTGAEGERDGLFLEADGGTLLLDEIGEIPPSTQVRLLRVLQEREVLRVGESRARPVDVRILAATNRNLEEEVAAGRFREDLYFRVNVIPIRVPPLRERREDLGALIPILLEKIAGEAGVEKVRLSRESHDLLLRHEWPGNVRELQNVLQRAVILADGGVVRVDDLPDPLRSPAEPDLPEPNGLPLPELVERIERRAIRTALAAHGGVRARAARQLGLPERVLRYKIQKYDIDPRKPRGTS
jgi:two-component system response regulator AtoC